jgi:hypothetical protein
MTLKNHKNHYNVKFLKGYCHSISIKDSKIILKDNHNLFSEPNIESWTLRSFRVEKEFCIIQKVRSLMKLKRKKEEVIHFQL